MAHQIHEHDGLVLNRESAWHGLGIVLDKDFGPEEALNVSGLNWEVGMTSLSHTINGVTESIEEFQAITRLDTKEVFQVFSKGYSPIQNKELFDLAYVLNKDILVESAGSLFNGRKVYICLRGDSFKLSNGDEICKYLILANSHDGTLTLTAQPTSIRPVCNNTLSMALKEGARRSFRVKHCGNTASKLKIMESALAKFAETGKWFEEQVNFLAKKELKSKQLMSFFTQCYEDLIGTPDSSEEKEEAKSTLEAWTTTLETERLIFDSPNTAWLAANAVTNWIQHREPGRVQNGWEERRMFNNLFATTIDASSMTMNLALKI